MAPCQVDPLAYTGSTGTMAFESAITAKIPILTVIRIFMVKRDQTMR